MKTTTCSTTTQSKNSAKVSCYKFILSRWCRAGQLKSVQLSVQAPKQNAPEALCGSESARWPADEFLTEIAAR